MSMRMNYKMYPTDYINELMQDGKREKAVRFMEYWHDMEHGIKNSIGFYAKSWSVSKSTAHGWIQEFKQEVSLFLAHWELKNLAHYNSVKNQAERLPNAQPNDCERSTNRDLGVCENATERLGERQPNEEFNIYDDDSDTRKEFENIFFIYSVNGGFTGKKDEAYQEYKKIRMEVEVDDLVEAISLYLHDGNVERKFNIKNFLKNKIYLGYIKQKIKIYTNGAWYVGKYDKDEEILYLDNGSKGVLKQDVFSKKLLKEELIVLGREVL